MYGFRYDSNVWRGNRRVALNNGPSNLRFSAIAQNLDHRVYAISGGAIHEYSWTEEDPMNMSYVGLVKLGPEP
jgi:hypothetical protein